MRWKASFVISVLLAVPNSNTLFVCLWIDIDAVLLLQLFAGFG